MGLENRDMETELLADLKHYQSTNMAGFACSEMRLAVKWH